MRNPLPLAALLYGSGLIVATWAPGHLVWLLALGFCLALLALCSEHLRQIALALLLPLAAWANFEARTAILSPNDLRLLMTEPAQDATIRGILCEAPVLRVHERGTRVYQRSVAGDPTSGPSAPGMNGNPLLDGGRA